jgi:hypothetical protein
MHSLSYLPFFYFQRTRLSDLKAWVFHSVYEWLPALLIFVYVNGFSSALGKLGLCYVAFISIYEIGYLVNDQNALREKLSRKRTGRLTYASIALFVILRCATFAGITYYLKLSEYELWWYWYALLVIVFTLHNFLTVPSLKVITFSYLAWARFLSPFFFIVPLSLVQILFLPVFLNYVLFRLFIYMDSKGLVQGFERHTNSYRLGFYLVLCSFSIVLSFTYQSWLPLALNLYFLFASVLFALVPNHLASRK